jgi:exosortase
MNDTRRNPVVGELALATGLTLLVLTWVYWPTFASLVRRWTDDPQASHGFLVPLLSLLILWFQWDDKPKTGAEPSWYGVLVLAFAAGLRFFGAYINFDWLDEVSFIVALAGVVLLLAGWRWLYWSRWALAFLVFMIPLPFLLERAVAGPLQRNATAASTYLLQMLGYPAVAEGNTILIDKVKFGVLEACNGLGMLQSFVMLSAAMALLSRRPLTERLILLASGLPIALLANLLRITMTALLMVQTSEAWLHKLIHDIAGWVMIPLALLFLWLVGKLMDNFWRTPTLEVGRPAPTASRQPTPTLTPN